MSSSSFAFQQRARLSTAAGAAIAPSQPLQAAAAAAAASAPKSMSRFGGGGKWAIIGTAAVALGAAAAVQLKGDDAARVAQAKAKAETDKRYQELLASYGSGETLEDLQNAVSSYSGSGRQP